MSDGGLLSDRYMPAWKRTASLMGEPMTASSGIGLGDADLPIWRPEDKWHWATPDKMKEGWQLKAGDRGPMPTTGAAAYAAPGLAGSIPLDRQSTNIEGFNWFDAVNNATNWALARKLGSLAIAGRALAGPKIEMRDIGSLLPQERIPYMGKP